MKQMDQMKRIDDKTEEKGIKSWFKKNGTNIVLGVVTVGGLCLSRYAYRSGYTKGFTNGSDTGYDVGYNMGFNDSKLHSDNFEITKVESF